MEEMKEKRKKYNMILLYFQKKEIYINYISEQKNNEYHSYYLTNKAWLEDYKQQFDFYNIFNNNIDLKDEDLSLLYINIKEKKKDLINGNHILFKDIYEKRIKEEDIK